MSENRQSRQERRGQGRTRPLATYPDTRSNILTLLLAVVIIVLGYLLPNLLYPLMDDYSNRNVVLKDSTSDSLAVRVYDEPVSLYPWNSYAPEACRGLTTEERSLLIARSIPDFLLATLADRGLSLPLDANGVPDNAAYAAAIIDTFQYLYVESESYANCFVLVDADVNGDGAADLSCAVELDGEVTSVLLKPEWSTISLTADDYPAPEPAVDPATNQASEGAAENTAGAPSAEGSVEGDGSAAEAGVEVGAGAGAGAETAGPSLPETLPTGEDVQLWPYVYATMHETGSFQQSRLAEAFALLDENYQYRYGYSYRLYLLFQSGRAGQFTDLETQGSVQGGEAIVEEATESGGAAAEAKAEERTDEEEPLLFPLSPTIFATEENLLYIYDLPNGARVIVYLNPETHHCEGFNYLTL